MDGDEAGQKATKRIPELIFPYLKPGHSLSFVKLPSGEDPDSLILSDNLFATAADDIKIWDIKTFKDILTIDSHSDIVVRLI